MNNEQPVEFDELGRFEKHKFVLLVVITIAVSLLLVIVSLWFYNTSGAAQLDLSRPGYESAREQAVTHTNFESFSSTGTLDREALAKFGQLYDDQMKEAKAVEAFGGDVMSDTALDIGAASNQ